MYIICIICVYICIYIYIIVKSTHLKFQEGYIVHTRGERKCSRIIEEVRADIFPSKLYVYIWLYVCNVIYTYDYIYKKYL